MRGVEWTQKYRPGALKEMVLPGHLSSMLKNMIKQGEIPHFVMLSGEAGTGKTTLARILAKSILNSKAEEYNSSDFRGIDFVREITGHMRRPSVYGKTTFHIFDEVHKLTNDAQNAFLKFLEDMPDFSYVVFCTTEPMKLIPAIRSRATEIQIPLVTEKDMEARLLEIADLENVGDVETEVLDTIHELCRGSMRKAVNLFQNWVISGKDFEVLQRTVDEESPEIVDLCRGLLNGTWKGVQTILKKLQAEPESVRYAVLGYMTTVLLSAGKNEVASIVIDYFSEPFYNSGKAGLANACYKSMHDEG